MNPRGVLCSPPNGHRHRPALTLCICIIVALGLVASIASLALAASASFPDVPSTHPYYAAITDLADRGIIGGKTDGKFYPSDSVTRQQFAKMIVGTGGYPVSEDDVCPFTDVQKGGASTLYPDNYIAVCAAKGITTGTTPTTFNPLGNITRFQVVSMVVRMADNLQPGLLAAPPAGWAGNTTWAANPTHGANAARAEYNGLLAGLELAALDPNGNMSRGEVAQVLYNLLGKLGPTTSGDLIHFWWTGAQDWKAENVSSATGVKISHAPAGWSLTVNAMPADDIHYVAATTPNDELVLFRRSSTWSTLNISQQTGQKARGVPANWGQGASWHLAVAGPTGNLLHFWGDMTDWQKPWAVEDVTKASGGPTVLGAVAVHLNWSTDPPRQQLVARSTTGDLIVFSDQGPLQDWTYVNLSAATGRKIAGPPTVWSEPGLAGGSRCHIAAVGTDGHLLHFSGAYVTATWEIVDLTDQLGHTFVPTLAAWGTYSLPEVTGIWNIAGVTPSGDLARVWRTESGAFTAWQYENLSTATGVKAAPCVSSYTEYVSSGGDVQFYDHLVVNSPSGDLLIFWDQVLNNNWRVVNVTDKTGETVKSPLSAWMNYGQSYTEAHMAGIKP